MGKKKNDKQELADQEVRGMESLAVFITDKEGGDKRMVEKYRCQVTIQPSNGRYNVYFFNKHGTRFRSKFEVGRFLNLLDDSDGEQGVVFQRVSLFSVENDDLLLTGLQNGDLFGTIAVALGFTTEQVINCYQYTNHTGVKKYKEKKKIEKKRKRETADKEKKIEKKRKRETRT